MQFDNFLQLFQSLKWFYFCSNVKKWLQPLSSFWMCSSGSWPSPRFTGVSFWLLKFDSQWIKCQTISNVFFAFDCNSNQCCGAFEHLRWKHWITHSSYLHILFKQYLVTCHIYHLSQKCKYLVSLYFSLQRGLSLWRTFLMKYRNTLKRSQWTTPTFLWWLIEGIQVKSYFTFLCIESNT